MGLQILRVNTMTRAIRANVFCIGLLGVVFVFAPASAAEKLEVGASEASSPPKVGAISSPAGPQSLISNSQRMAEFLREPASKGTRHLANWITATGDNHRLPFVIVDKVDAKVFVFDKDGRLGAVAPALVGLARGDYTVPGIGGRELSTIRPEERITPAGRFVAALGHDFGGTQILWVDYNTGIALHPVITTNPKEHRLQRLATPTPLDNRISFGCINVPANFFKTAVAPAFTGTDGVVYILPEAHSIGEIFSAYYEVD